MDFDFNLPMGSMSAIASVIAAIASACSAAIAYRAFRNLTTADRNRRVQQLSLLAHKIDAAATDVHELVKQLNLGYDQLYGMAGRSGSGLLSRYKEEIRESGKVVRPLQQEANDLLNDNLGIQNDEQIAILLQKLDGYLVRIERVRIEFETKQASIRQALDRLEQRDLLSLIARDG